MERLYKVVRLKEPAATRLIKAGTLAQLRAHLVSELFEISLAEPLDVAEVFASVSARGGKFEVETANQETQ